MQGMSAPVATRFDPQWSPARPRRLALIVGVAIVVVAWSLALAAVVLAVIAGPPYLVKGDFMTIYLGYAIVWGGIAGLLVARGSRFVGAILAVQGLGAGLSALLTVLMRFEPVSSPTYGLLAHLADRPWIPGALASFSILPLLLTTRSLTTPTRALVTIGLIVSLLPAVIAPFRQREGQPVNPLAVADPVAQEVLRSIVVTSFSAAVIVGIASLGVACWRRWAGPMTDRRGQGWIVLGQALLVVFVSPIFLPGLPQIAQTFDRVAPVAPLVGLLFMPAAVIVFALGRRVGGIELTVNRALVNVMLLAVLVTAYTAVATTLALAFPVAPLIAGVIGVAVLALGLAPLQRWVQARVDELVYGDAADPMQLVRALGDRLPDGVDGDDLRSLADELRVALRLARLELRSAEPGGVLAISGGAGGPVSRIPLRGSDGEVGWIDAAAPGRQRVDRRAIRVLERVSGVLAIAVRLAEVNREILDAGERAREVGAEERRMVARELDQGLGPGLARSADRLDRVPALVTAGAAEAGTELAEVRLELAERTTEVRDLARTLLPGALDSGDLDTALRELAARFSSAKLGIEVQGVLGDAIPEGREAAVHHLVAELVLLVRRAPGARHADIDLETFPRSVRIGLTVDGRAREVDEAAILGSIRDRIDELGGSFADTSTETTRALLVELPR
jgi:signal transduction histidine kinase